MTAAAERVDPFYAVVRLVARFWVWFLFRDVVVRHLDRVPATGPVLLCVNHPNNLVDSVLVGAAVPRKVHYLATGTLFRHPLLARFLRACGVVPVHRRADGPAPAERKAETFAACRRILAAGGVVAIYPEGTTHAEPRVQRIRTGAARIALEHASAPGAAPLAVVPVGLSFEARKSFRATVLVRFGPPLPLALHVRRAATDPVGAVQALTAALQAAMEAEVAHVDRIDAAELVAAVEALYRDEVIQRIRAERGLPAEAVDSFELSRTITTAVAHFQAHDPERVARLWRAVQRYRALLAAYHVHDGAVTARLGRGPAPRAARTSGLAILGLPVFVYGAVVNALPYVLPRWAARRLAEKETDYATIRLLATVVAVPVFWGLETWAAWRAAGPGWALAFAASLPLSGLAAYGYARGAGRLAARIRFAWLALTRRRTASRLLLQRRAILAQLEDARRAFLARPDRPAAPVPAAAGRAAPPAPAGGAAAGRSGRA